MRQTKYRFTIEGEFDRNEHDDFPGKVSGYAVNLQHRLEDEKPSYYPMSTRVTRIDVQEIGEEDKK